MYYYIYVLQIYYEIDCCKKNDCHSSNDLITQLMADSLSLSEKWFAWAEPNSLTLLWFMLLCKLLWANDDGNNKRKTSGLKLHWEEKRNSTVFLSRITTNFMKPNCSKYFMDYYLRWALILLKLHWIRFYEKQFPFLRKSSETFTLNLSGEGGWRGRLKWGEESEQQSLTRVQKVSLFNSEQLLS